MNLSGGLLVKKKYVFVILACLLLIVIALCVIWTQNGASSRKGMNEQKETSKINKSNDDNQEKKAEKHQAEEQNEKEEKTEEKKEDSKAEEDKKGESTSKEEEVPSSSLSAQEQENNQKRGQLESSYGLRILYGNESMYASHELVKTNDEGIIRNQLNILEEELTKYPYGFFHSFSNEGMPLSIFLVESVVGRDIAGAADTSDATQPKLILTNRNFRETFHHEMMHCIDLYLRIMMYRDGADPYSEYESYNPSDFAYGNTSYRETDPTNPHFWFDYAKTSVEEDRAELFKAMMTVRSVLLKRGSLQQKGIVISRQLKTYFSISGRPYWEQSIDVSL